MKTTWPFTRAMHLPSAAIVSTKMFSSISPFFMIVLSEPPPFDQVDINSDNLHTISERTEVDQIIVWLPLSYPGCQVRLNSGPKLLK